MLALPSAAAAEDFCVVNANVAIHADCPATHTTETTVQAALTAAAGSAAADRVYIGDTVGPEDGGTYGSATSAVEILGAGRDATLLQPRTGDQYTLGGLSSGATVRDLTVDTTRPSGTPSGPRGLELSGGTATDVNVAQSDASVLNGAGVVFTAGGTFTRGIVLFPSDVTPTAFVTLAGDARIANSVVTGVNTGVSSVTGTTTTISQTRFRVRGQGLSGGGNLNVHDVLIDLPSGFGVGVWVFYNPGPSGNPVSPITVNANHVTVAGAAGGDDVGGIVNATDPGGGETNVLNVRNSILATKHSFQRNASGTGSPGNVANITTDHSNYPAVESGASTNSGTGAGSITETAHTAKNPGFVNAAGHNFRLAAGSPMIDVGTTQPLSPGEPTTDLASNPRIVDGNADCVARRDVGAYEFQPTSTDCGSSEPPPGSHTRITSGPTGLTTAAPTFTFTTDYVNPKGFECRFDGAAFRPCTSPHQVFNLSLGPHRFAVRAIDSSGKPDPIPAERGFTMGTLTHKDRCIVFITWALGDLRTCKAFRGTCPVGSLCTLTGTVDVHSEDQGNSYSGSVLLSFAGSFIAPNALAASCDSNNFRPRGFTNFTFTDCPQTTSLKHIGANDSAEAVCSTGGETIDESLLKRGPDGERYVLCEVSLKLEPIRSLNLAALNGLTVGGFMPGPGRLTVDTTGVRRAKVAVARKRRGRRLRIKRVRVKVRRAGPVRFKLKPNKPARRLLRRGKKLRLSLKLTFKPKHGKRRIRRQKLTIRLSRCARIGRKRCLRRGTRRVTGASARRSRTPSPLPAA